MSKITKLIIFLLLLVMPQLSQLQTLKVLSFNIRYDSYQKIDGDNGWDYRKDAVVKMINTERPDVFGLQEALEHQLDYLDQQLLSYRRVGVGRDNGYTEGEYMAIYYNINRLKLVSAKTRWLSETPLLPSLGWDAACRRTVTIAQFRDLESGEEFVYMNTHLDHVGDTARAESTKIIANYAAQLAYSTPVIVGGDMNSPIEDTIFDNFYNVGLEPARSLTQFTSNAITYNAFGKDSGAVIDHFFVNGIKVRRFRTLNGDYGVPYISDHYPIEMVIKL
ncbi:MAG: endonuclease/exonuclease/phosphatase family protein [Bacteroidales bacterium]|nr:endonuclease/exonuclease/phosphatase family protein [Bacteroidales bacterium]